ncbi:MAG: multidrug transporter [Chitinophagaceae bacterium]|nr:MAG: multidrug transporter [Chitinophagaceae bacterium]
MNIGDHYNLSEFIKWTRRKLYWLAGISFIVTFSFEVLGLRWLAVPWVPIALIGTAAAFIAGFRNTQTYNRVWEARTLWGAIVNSSRTWGIMVQDFVRHSDPQIEKQIQETLIYRHIAWLTCLRFQLREIKPWENIKTRSYNTEYLQNYRVPEWESDLSESLRPLVSDADHSFILAKKNRAAQIIAMQSAQLRTLQTTGMIEPLFYVELENILKELYQHQGGCERIKNFPYPRQFASINLFFIRLLLIILPFGMLNEFSRLGPGLVWLTIPFTMLVGWVFATLEQVGEATENPFEGGANDVPITTLARNIEIDLRDMLGESGLPSPIAPQHEILL